MSDIRSAAVILAGAILINKLFPVSHWAYLDRVMRRRERKARRIALKEPANV